MHKRDVFIHGLVLLALIAILAACSSTRTHESTGQYIDSSAITTQVKALLAADDFLNSFAIGVETYKNVVQLSGFVDSEKAREKAEKLAESVEGVKSVKNDLIVK
ncbi:MAG TPA: transporter [Syntrophus sp. (in: bacteria)]|jgi:osmotically-inducible protein OsmY|nr:transporter [Syntrophus sp. (in: bacteria)]